MEQHQYSPGIVIKGQYRHNGNFVTLKKSSADPFIAKTKSCLDEIKETKTGARLISEINASGHIVSIYRTKDKLKGGNSQGGDSATSGIDMIKDLKTKYTDGTTELQDVLALATQDMSKRSKFKKALHIGKAKPKFLKQDAIARLVGTTPKGLVKMAAGRMMIPPNVDAKIRTYLYDFLTPGRGESCYVNFNHLRDNLSADHKKYLPQGLTWKHRPPGVALAHELIHAWRVMTGMVLFKYGWEEEAMTVGLPPFSNMPLTENKVRVDWGGLAIRPHYERIGMKTGIIDPKQTGIAPGTNTWQGKDSALHANKVLAKAMSDRRRALGFDDSDDDDEDEEWDD